jgi:hypothetical protein
MKKMMMKLVAGFPSLAAVLDTKSHGSTEMRQKSDKRGKHSNN